MRKRTYVAIAALLPGAVAIGAAPRRDAPRADVVAKLVACRAIPDMAQRVACYDQQVTALDEATKRKDVVVVDREQVRETRKTLFGLSLPRLDIFSGADDDEVHEVRGKVASASADAEGRLIVRLEDGARWHQTDDVTIGRFPKPGTEVVIKRGALTSYRMVVGGQPGVKAKREN